METSLEKSKKLNEVNKPLHPSTNHEILVKFWSICFWATGVRKSTIKKIF